MPVRPAAQCYWQQDLADNGDGPISPDHFRPGIAPLTAAEIDEFYARLGRDRASR